MIKNQKTAITFLSFWCLETSSSPKINRLTAICFLKFKGTWQAHFLSHTLHILKIIITFEDVILVLLVFFDISHGLGDRKFGSHCSLHLLSTSLDHDARASDAIVLDFRPGQRIISVNNHNVMDASDDEIKAIVNSTNEVRLEIQVGITETPLGFSFRRG